MSPILKSVSSSANGLARLLVVGRAASSGGAFDAPFDSPGWETEVAGSGCEALERLQANHTPDLVIVDLDGDDADGMYALRWLRRVRPGVPVILVGAADDARRNEALRLGARDYLVKPVTPRQLRDAVEKCVTGNQDADSLFVTEQVVQVREDRYFITAGPLTRKLRSQAELLAQVDVPLLIVGESGSGKETMARLIHKLSVRASLPFLKVNCAALPADLLERELFGYEPATHSGARTKPGKFDLAENGTLFLDDIADIPLNLQAKILHVLQEKQFSRPGSGTSVKVDVRVAAATGLEVERAMREKRLREELFYRLSAFTVHVPSLRQRQEEVPFLIGHFMNQIARHYGLPTRPLSTKLLEACQSYAWPGNLRELESFVKRYLIMGHEELLLGDPRRNGNRLVEHQVAALEPVVAAEAAGPEDRAESLRSLVQTVKGEAERSAIAGALDQTRWNRKAAARLLKVSYRTLLYKIQQYQMSPPPTFHSASFGGQATKGNGHGP